MPKTVAAIFYYQHDVKFIIDSVPRFFCSKGGCTHGDFEKEVQQNGFADSLKLIQKRMMRIWEGEKWDSGFNFVSSQITY